MSKKWKKRDKKKRGKWNNMYTYTGYSKCECHPEIKLGKGVLTGGRSVAQKKKADLFIALDKYAIENYPMDTGGEVGIGHRFILFPIDDRCIPKPADMPYFYRMISIIIQYLKNGKRVHVQCMGGHGRTGLVLSCVLGKMRPDIKDPVAHIREIYCKKAVETYEQHKLIATYTKCEIGPTDEEYKPKYVAPNYDDLGTFNRKYFGDVPDPVGFRRNWYTGALEREDVTFPEEEKTNIEGGDMEDGKERKNDGEAESGENTVVSTFGENYSEYL
jgi:hypothetical protein